MISKLEINALRGITNVELELFNESLVIYGENGYGKSSIVDAIELSIQGRISHLDDSGQQVSTTKHAHHVLSTPQKMWARLTFKDGSTLENGRPSSRGTSADLLHQGGANGINILRRSHLLEAVSSIPSERYKMLEPFLPLGETRKYEETHKNLMQRLNSDLESVKGAYRDISIQLATQLRLSDFNDLDDCMILQRIQTLSELANVTKPHDLDTLTLKESLDNIQKTIKSLNMDEVYQRRLQLVQALEKLLGLPVPTEPLNQLLSRREELVQLSNKLKSTFYEDVLKRGADWIRDEALNLCPLCENQIDAQTVLERVETRLHEHSEYIQAKESFKQVQQVLMALILKWKSTVHEVQQTAVTLKEASLEQPLQFIYSSIESLLPLCAQSKNVQELSPPTRPKWPEELMSNFQATHNQYQSLLPKEDKMERFGHLLSLEQSLCAILIHYPALKKKAIEVATAKKRYQTMLLFGNQMQQERKALVQTIYQAIEADINHFYNSMHPDESIGDVRLSLRETGTKSTLLQSSFHGKSGQDPRAYYSESHLDTLGLAVFLALYKREAATNPALRFLVLDDVLHSVDAPHRRRVARTLFQEFRNQQLIITTHDRVWFQDLQDIRSTHGMPIRFVEIARWSLQEGPLFRDAMNNIQSLQRLASTATDTQTLASKAGWTFEYILQELRYSLGLKIPARLGERYTIADIWNILLSELRKGKAIPGFVPTHERVLHEIETFLSIRNRLGAHYNQWADDSSTMSEVLSFAHAILEFANLVYCHDCGKFVAVDNKTRTCKCKSLTYSPVSSSTP